MLFLLNTVVVQVPDVIQLPKGLGRLARANRTGVLKAGAELFERHPRLETERLDIAQWYCGLLASKFPDAGGALFERYGSEYVGRLAEIPIHVLATFWRDQRDGRPIARDVERYVWGPVRTQMAGLVS